jgi:hypothetical protein
LEVEFDYLPRFLELSNEMPIRNHYELQIVGMDETGIMTEYVLVQGLKSIKNLEAISLNLSIRDVAIDNFVK